MFTLDSTLGRSCPTLVKAFEKKSVVKSKRYRRISETTAVYRAAEQGITQQQPTAVGSQNASFEKVNFHVSNVIIIYIFECDHFTF